MKKNYFLTIITITKDDSAGLEKTINSIPLDSDHVEIIIIDGSLNKIGSTKNTNKYLEEYHENYIIKKQKSKGLFEAMNEGLTLAKGEWVIFMNGGDEFDKNIKFKYLKNTLNNKYNCFIFQTEIYSKNLSRRIGINPPYINKNKDAWEFLLKVFPSVFWPSHQSIIFNTKEHREIMYPSNPIGSDQLVLSNFLKGNYKTIKLILSKTDTSGISSIPPQSFKQYYTQINSSINLGQYRRFVKLTILFLLKGVLNGSNYDRYRLAKYKVIDIIGFIFKREEKN